MLDYIPLTAAAGRGATTRELAALAADRMRALGYPVVREQIAPSGSGLRFDIVGVAALSRQVRIYEVKSSRGDYLCDTKWERYLPYCTHFAFVAPAGAIARWELPHGVGLIEYGAPPFERMRRARRFGLTIVREDCLRAVRPSLRLRDRVADKHWIALLESFAFAGRGPADETFAAGMGI